MPSETTPVILRSSVEASIWWSQQVDDAVAKQQVQNTLFTDKELSTLPYRRQNAPSFGTTFFGTKSSGDSRNFGLPYVKTSREIERGILQRELQLLEQDDENFKQHAHNNQRLLLNINRALAVKMAAQM